VCARAFPIGALVYAYNDTFIDANLTDKFMFLLVFIISLYVYNVVNVFDILPSNRLRWCLKP